LIELELVNCQITDAECGSLSDLESLKYLNLSCNQIGPAGLEKIFKKVMSIETLIMYDCDLGKPTQGRARSISI
jgi:hypothetical protein